MPEMISKSRLNRRLHALEDALWQGLFAQLAEPFKKKCHDAEPTYAVDSIPVPVCDNIRIRRRRLYPSEEPGANVAAAAGRFTATSRASGATSTVYGYT